MKKEGRKKEIDDQFKQLCLVEIEIEHILVTGHLFAFF